MKKPEKRAAFSSIDLTGQFLIAMPGMGDTRFERGVVYICTHSSAGAMGIIVNKRLSDISFNEILYQVAGGDIANTDKISQKVWFGGPVEPGRGLVLHSADYELPTSMKIDDEVLLTASTEILKDIACGDGPKESLLALGYAGWGGGQLEDEIFQNSWLTSSASAEILFDPAADEKYQRVLNEMGIDPTLLSVDAGHA